MEKNLENEARSEIVSYFATAQIEVLRAGVCST